MIYKKIFTTKCYWKEFSIAVFAGWWNIALLVNFADVIDRIPTHNTRNVSAAKYRTNIKSNGREQFSCLHLVNKPTAVFESYLLAMISLIQQNLTGLLHCYFHKYKLLNSVRKLPLLFWYNGQAFQYTQSPQMHLTEYPEWFPRLQFITIEHNFNVLATKRMSFFFRKNVCHSFLFLL